MYARAPPSRAAVGVVLGQGQGSDTVGLVAAAGEAAEHRVDSVAWGAACAGPLRLRLAAEGQMCAAMSACGESLHGRLGDMALMSTQSRPAGETMSRKRRPLAALALIAMVVLISACGSSAPAEHRRSGSGDNTTATAHAKAVKFAECIRGNGVSEFPDPDASGQFAYGIPSERLAAGPEQRGVAAGDRRVQDPGASGVHAHELHSHSSWRRA